MQLGTTNLLCPFQKRWLLESAPLAFWEKSRRIGATWVHALRVTLARAGSSPASPFDYWHSSTDMSAAAEFIGYCADWAKMVNEVARLVEAEEIVDEQKINTMQLRFGNGFKIVAGSSNPKFFRSKGGEVGLDEFAFHAQGRELFKAAHATAMFWGYPIRIWSSHNGPGSYFNQRLIDARSGSTGSPGRLKAAVHRVTIEDAVADGIVERVIMRRDKLDHVPAPDDGARRAWLDELRATCPDQDTWNEEYLCIPSSDQSSLLSYEQIASVVAENLKLFESPSDLPHHQGEFYAGYDVGRRHDFSVLWVGERVGDVLWTRMLRCLDRASFSAQEALIVALMSNQRVRRICIDEQGIGAQLAENAMQRFKSRAEGVSLSGPVKTSLGMTFRDRFVDRLLRIPSYVDWEEFDDQDPLNRIVNRRNLRKRRHRDDWLREDLHKTKKSVSASGNVRLSAESDSDGHADGFWAGALMNEAAQQEQGPLPAPRMKKWVGW